MKISHKCSCRKCNICAWLFSFSLFWMHHTKVKRSTTLGEAQRHRRIYIFSPLCNTPSQRCSRIFAHLTLARCSRLASKNSSHFSLACGRRWWNELWRSVSVHRHAIRNLLNSSTSGKQTVYFFINNYSQLEFFLNILLDCKNKYSFWA